MGKDPNSGPDHINKTPKYRVEGALSDLGKYFNKSTDRTDQEPDTTDSNAGH